MTVEPQTLFEETHDGLTQLRRRWVVSDPRASVLIVHGIGEHSGRYLHVGARLAEVGFDVLAFDNRGFGQSGGRRAFVESFDQYLDDVAPLIEERRSLGVPVILLGHSLGGLISTAYLESERPSPDVAVLSAPALRAEVPAWQRMLAPILGRLLPKFFLKAKIDGDLLSRDLEVQKAYADDPLIVTGSTAGLGYEIFQAMEAATANVGRVTLPVYVLHGEIDKLVPLGASDCLAELDNVDRRIWEGVRHEAFNEPEQAEVMGEMIEWLEAQIGRLKSSGSSSTDDPST